MIRSNTPPMKPLRWMALAAMAWAPPAAMAAGPYAIESLNAAPTPEFVREGSSVTIRVTAPSTALVLRSTVRLNGKNVTSALVPEGTPGVLVGTVPGLKPGANVLELYAGKTASTVLARTTVSAAVTPLISCESIATTVLPETTLTAVTVAEGSVVGGAAMPEHCLVNGQMSPRVGEDGRNYYIGFQLRVPTRWNGRFLFQGGGGNDGAVQAAVGSVGGSLSALARGFAVASTDGGHQGGGATFRLDPQARLDHAYGAYTRVTETSKALLTAGFSRPVDKSYFMGCSGGGRQAMMFPQRFPSYFDGIAANAPGMRAAREATVAAVWSVKSYLAAAPLNAAGSPILSRSLSNADMQLLSDAIVRTCDAIDGAADGIISVPPQACHFDPAALLCPGAKDDSCLSAEQVSAVKADFGGPVNSAGDALYIGFPWDAGISTSGWRSWKLGTSGTANPNAIHASLFGGNVGYQFTPPEPGFPYLTFNFDTDMARMDEQAAILNTTSPVLDSFASRGGKMLLSHGTSDPAFSANDTVRYIQDVKARYGAAADDITRLFLVPGMNHCSGGPATDRFDLLAPLINWVENGVAPAQIMATAGPASPWPGRTRPLCPYPAYAKYLGTGDLERASSFQCVVDE
jgi:hypothetical protein